MSTSMENRYVWVKYNKSYKADSFWVNEKDEFIIIIYVINPKLIRKTWAEYTNAKYVAEIYRHRDMNNRIQVKWPDKSNNAKKIIELIHDDFRKANLRVPYTIEHEVPKCSAEIFNDFLHIVDEKMKDIIAHKNDKPKLQEKWYFVNRYFTLGEETNKFDISDKHYTLKDYDGREYDFIQNNWGSDRKDTYTFITYDTKYECLITKRIDKIPQPINSNEELRIKKFTSFEHCNKLHNYFSFNGMRYIPGSITNKYPQLSQYHAAIQEDMGKNSYDFLKHKDFWLNKYVYYFPLLAYKPNDDRPMLSLIAIEELPTGAAEDDTKILEVIEYNHNLLSR